MFRPIHKHLLVRGFIKAPFKSDRAAKEFLVNLVHLVGMQPVTEPQAVYVGDAGNEGFTGSINLATSHAAFHIWDRNGLLMFDIYSCKDFDENLVIDFIHEHLIFVEKPATLVLDREKDLCL